MENYSDSDTESDFSESETENEYDLCCQRGSGTCALPFDPTSIENIILSISDQFNFRILLNDSRVKSAIAITTGLTLAGSLIGKHYGGKVGAAVGGAVGGVCGLGIIAVSMRDIWQDIKGKLSELFDIVYDYLAGLGINDYKMAAKFLMQNSWDSRQLAGIVLQVSSDVLGKKILSSLNAAI
ncbi:uncharacterized protein LOC116778992 [Danaus plexippus]|uniref:Uncharacterized protein n=1 Tax=Danaus plexippus plexippus TaxID=278856 RepID=A0A212F4V3_DANPL|nr:uncharacterized protein LOC116778992 [Danaus plexippus]OWR48764.1 hypothetical protein KGM_201929 [Danaus plexippus plexippus]